MPFHINLNEANWLQVNIVQGNLRDLNLVDVRGRRVFCASTVAMAREPRLGKRNFAPLTADEDAAAQTIRAFRP